MAGQPLPHYTQMCTRQLQSLHELPLSVVAKFDSLHRILMDNNVSREAFTKRFVEKVQSLLALFQSSFLDLVLEVIPLIPVKNDYKACFATWNTQLLIATHNIIDLALSDSDNPT
jgi:hypothetical protein